MTRRVWDRYYEISIKNLVDAIHNSADKANLNAALRILSLIHIYLYLLL